MKPTMMFAIVMITAIVIIAGFGLQMDQTPLMTLPPDTAGNVLFVCPAADGIWDGLALGMRAINRYATFGFFAAAFVLMFMWGWNLYQNLLKDKFERSSFTNVWQFTKILFWAGVILLIAAMTPNYFRRVTVTGADGHWVLCESNTPGARATWADAVHSH